VEASYAEPVAVVPQGTVVFLGIYTFGHSLVDSFTIGAGCAITEVESTDTGIYLSGMAITTDGTKLFTSSDMDHLIQSYAISGATLQLLQATLADLPSIAGLASMGNLLFSGGGYVPTESAGYTFATSGQLTPLPGSPASDSQGANGTGLRADRADRQVINAESFSGSFGLYGWRNGSYTLLAHALGAGTYTPTVMTQLGHWLLVTNESGASISPCIVGGGTLVCLPPIYLPVLRGPNGIASF
jgi:hypothetical protein